MTPVPHTFFRLTSQHTPNVSSHWQISKLHKFSHAFSSLTHTIFPSPHGQAVQLEVGARRQELREESVLLHHEALHRAVGQQRSEAVQVGGADAEGVCKTNIIGIK